MEKNAIIIGCGIAGPVLALQLKRAGIKSTIYEAEKTPFTLGLFIYLSPNGMNVIRSLGVYDKIKKLGIETHTSIFYNEKGRMSSFLSNHSKIMSDNLYRITQDKTVAFDYKRKYNENCNYGMKNSDRLNQNQHKQNYTVIP